jgi:hypothetical protein
LELEFPRLFEGLLEEPQAATATVRQRMLAAVRVRLMNHTMSQPMKRSLNSMAGGR